MQMAARAASDAHAKSEHSSVMSEKLKKRSWGLCILDEVHSGGKFFLCFKLCLPEVTLVQFYRLCALLPTSV